MSRVCRPIQHRNGSTIVFQDNTYIDFSSNDYLGLSQDPVLIDTFTQALHKYPLGSTGSRLLSGDYDICHTLEDAIAQLMNTEDALLFNSGYHANTGFFRAIVGKQDVVFADKLIHASLLDGIILSGAKLIRYKHQNMTHLAQLLRTHRQAFSNALIVTESLFSMDGDIAPLQELVALKNTYHCDLYIDEAHAFGLYGHQGAGLVEEENLTHEVTYMMGTFGKALGSYGAFLTCSSATKKRLINQCRSLLYSTALPPAFAAVNLKGLSLLQTEPHRRQSVRKQALTFRQELTKKGVSVLGQSHIVPIVIGDTSSTIRLANSLRALGFWCPPIRPPSVPEGTSRLRLSLTYHHTSHQLCDLTKALADSTI